MTTKLDPRRWRTVGGVFEHHCAPCDTWFAHTPEHFHKHRTAHNGLQDYCKRCMCKIVATRAQIRRQRRHMAMLRARTWFDTLPPLLALDRITEAWAER